MLKPETRRTLKDLARVIELTAVLIALAFVAYQTKAIAQTLDEMHKHSRIYASLAVGAHQQRINAALLEHRDLRDAFGYSARDVLAYMMISDFERLYLQRREGFIDDEYWKSLENLMENTLDRDWVRSTWDRNSLGHNELHPAFVGYVNGLLKARSAPSP